MFKSKIEKELEAQRKAIKAATRGAERADMVYDHIQLYLNDLLDDKQLNLMEYGNISGMFLANVVAALPNRDKVNQAFKEITTLAREIGKQGRDENVVDINAARPMVDSAGNKPGGDVA